MKNKFLRVVCTSCLRLTVGLVFLLTSASVFAAEVSGSARPLKCVYFIPSDCDAFPDRGERLFRVMSCVQEFYRNEMERNGFGPMTFGLEEEKSGVLKLYEVRAPEKQAEYGRDSYWKVRDVVAKELEKQGIDINKEVVVIFQIGLRWEGDRAIEVSSFVGAGAPSNGTAWFYDDPMLDSDKLSSKEPGGYYSGPCSIGSFNTHYIGGIAHELGHALTLPHDCELSKDLPILGNALMGAGNHTFGRELRGEGKGAFLTYSEALRLSVVPAISGKEPQRRTNDLKLVELKGKRVSKNAIRLSGKVEGSSPILGLIFYEDLDSRGSDYDAKTWVVKPENGNFEVELTEVAPEPSELRVCAVRDVDTVELGRFSYNPDGSKDEFGPIERSFQLQKISAAYTSKDVDSLQNLANIDFSQSSDLKALCEELTLILKTPNALSVPADVAANVSEFDLSDAKFSEEKVGWARLQRRAAYPANMLILCGNGYASGLWAHAPSNLNCDLGKKWKKFEAVCGIEDGSNGSVEFLVRGDGKELFQCRAKPGQEFHVSVDVEGVQTLELISTDGGDGGNSDHSIWVNPKLSR